MRITAFCITALCLFTYAAHADEVGRRLNWQTLGSANYVEQTLPSRVEADESGNFELPALGGDSTGQPGGDDLARSPSVYVTSIELLDSTIFEPAELSALLQPYLERRVTLDELQDLRLQLSQVYIDRGYVNSGVVIPKQDVSDGRVVLQAIEGSLADVEIQGDPKLADRYIRGRLNKNIDTPLNVENVKNALQNLQRDRHVEWIDARLVPSDELGVGVLKVKIAEPPRFEVGLSADNHRTSSTGAERGRVSFRSSNLTGYGEVFRVSGGVTEGADELMASFEIPVTRWDTRLQLYYSASDADIVEDAFERLDIESESDTAGFMLTQPIIDTLNNTLSLSIGLEKKSSETTLLGEKFSFSPGAQRGEANTAVAMLGVDWVNRGDSHVGALRGTWRHGLDALDATIFDPETELEALQNPTGADGEFDALVIQGLYIKRMNSWFEGLHERSQFILRLTGQYSMDPLMSLEKLAIGGANTVRGYPENLLVRDNGWAGTIEIQFPIPGYSEEPGWQNLVFAPFIDVGQSWDDVDVDLISTLRDTDEKRMLVGAGVGFIWEPLANLRAQLYYGYDVSDNFDGDDPRDSESRDDDIQQDGIHFSVSYSRSF